MFALTPAQCKNLLQWKDNPADAFDKVVKRSEEFTRAHTLITRKHGVLVSLFDLARVDFAAVGQAGRGLAVDMLHFVSSRQGPTAVKHGLRKLDKNGRFVLECRNLLHLLFQSWRKVGKGCPRTFENFLSNLVMANFSAACTPHNGGGKPYNAKKKKAIPKSSRDYEEWETCVEDLLGLQLAVLCELSRIHNVSVLAITVGGKGTRGARMKAVNDVLSKLSEDDKSLIRISDVAYKHPCMLMPAKARSTPSLEEMCEFKNVMFAALKVIGLAPERLRLTFKIVEKLWHAEVSLVSFTCLFASYQYLYSTNL